MVDSVFRLMITINVVVRSFAKKITQLNVNRKAPIHILFCTVDHYEPGVHNADSIVESQRVDDLLEKYPKLVDGHSDSAGNLPRRTWFFPPHYHRYFTLKKLVKLCEAGYGDIELHLHHGKTQPDTPENLEKTLKQCIEEYSLFGIFGEEEGNKKYGFIHGDWALDNSRGGKYCGVNNEIDILLKTGCYADFTFPAMNQANPLLINSIYYACDHPSKPKSYNTGKLVEVNSDSREGLMMFQGPLYPFFKQDKISGFRALGDVINGVTPITSKRIDSWVKTGIHVKGAADVVFVKTHTHGAVDAKMVLGDNMDFIFSHLEGKYNDSENYILHYVTAREMYNIACALEDGCSSDSLEDYRDYKVKKPLYDSTPDIEGATSELNNLVFKTYDE